MRFLTNGEELAASGEVEKGAQCRKSRIKVGRRCRARCEYRIEHLGGDRHAAGRGRAAGPFQVVGAQALHEEVVDLFCHGFSRGQRGDLRARSRRGQCAFDAVDVGAHGGHCLRDMAN